MIHAVLPAQYSPPPGVRLAEPHKQSMAAVLRAVVDDCRRSSIHQRAIRCGAINPSAVRKAMVYVTSSDRAWPLSFENLCDALGLDADALREDLDPMRAPRGRTRVEVPRQLESGGGAAEAKTFQQDGGPHGR